MSSDSDQEERLLRERLAALEDRILAFDRNYLERPRYMVGKVYNAGAMGSTAGLYYATHPTTVIAASTEGGIATIVTETTQTVIIRVIGAAPVVGDYLIGATVPYRWEAEKSGTGGGPPPPCGQICTTIVGCGVGGGAAALTIEARLAGVFVGGCTTDTSGVCCIPITTVGTYVLKATNSAGATTSITAVLTGPCTTFTRTIPFPNSLSARVVGCDGVGLIGPADVSFTSGGTTYGSCSGVAGFCSIIPNTYIVAGTVITATVSYKGRTVTRTFTGCGAGDFRFLDFMCLHVIGCGPTTGTGPLPLPGALVTFSCTAGVIGTGTTDASGNVCVISAVGVLPTDTITVVVSKARFATQTTTFPGLVCIAPDVTLLPDSAHNCWCFCVDPLNNTITITDPFGPVLCTWDGIDSWVGCAMRTALRGQNPGPCGTPPFSTNPSVPVFFKFSSGGGPSPCGLTIGMYVCTLGGGFWLAIGGHSCADPPQYGSNLPVAGSPGTHTCPDVGFSWMATKKFSAFDAMSLVYGTVLTNTFSAIE